MAETKKDKDKKLKNMQISAPTTVNLDDLQTIIERNTLFQKKAYIIFFICVSYFLVLMKEQ